MEYDERGRRSRSEDSGWRMVATATPSDGGEGGRETEASIKQQHAQWECRGIDRDDGYETPIVIG